MQDAVEEKAGPEQAAESVSTGEAVVDNAESTGDFVNLDIDITPFLPEPVLPAWNFLQDYPLVLILLMFSIGYGLGKALQWLLRSSLEHAVRRTETKFDDKLIQYLTAPVVQTTVILALVAASKAFGFSENVDWFVVRTLFSMLLIFWGRAWFKATTLAINVMSKEVDRFELFQPRTRPLFEMGIKIFLFTVLVWMFMLLWNIDGTAWLASAGVIGIAVGFAARDTLANLISGVSIIADAPYKLGDYIILDTGERGVVTELGMRSTRLLTRDDVEMAARRSSTVSASRWGWPTAPSRPRWSKSWKEWRVITSWCSIFHPRGCACGLSARVRWILNCLPGSSSRSSAVWPGTIC